MMKLADLFILRKKEVNWASPLWEYALVSVVWAWVAWPFLIAGKFVYGFDTLSYSGPATKTTFEAWKSLRIPLWSEHIFGGVPFLGRLGAQALYFPNLPFAFFQLNTAMDLIMAAHLLLLGFGVLVLVRYGFGLSSPAGSISAITVLTSAFVGVKTLSFDQLIALSWLPWILFFLEKMITAEKPYKYFTGLSLSVSALVLGGHPQFIYLFLGLSVLFGFARLFDYRAWKSVIPLVLCAASSVGICLLQIYATYSLNSSSVMGAKKSLASLSNSAYVLPSNKIFQGVVGDPFSSNPIAVSGAGEAIAGISVLVLLLGVLGCYKLWKLKQRYTLAVLGLLGIIAVPLSVGPEWAIFELFYDWIPGFGNARVPGRLLSLTLVCVVLLSAFGVQFVIESFNHRGTYRKMGGLICVLSALAFVLIQQSQDAVRSWLFLVTVGLLVALLSLKSQTTRKLLSAVSLVFLVLVPAYASQRHSLGRLSQYDYPFDSYSSDIDKYLDGQEGLTIAMTFDRVGNTSYLVTSLRPNTNILHNIRLIDGYDGGMWVQKRWVEAMKTVTGGVFNNDLTVRSQVVFPIKAQVLARQGVRWALIDTEVVSATDQLLGWNGPLMTDGTLQLWQNPNWNGLASIYSKSVAVGQKANTNDLLQITSDTSTALVENRTQEVRCVDSCTIMQPYFPVVSGTQRAFETINPQQTVAAIHTSWSKDWRVYINGIATDIFPIDMNQVGFIVPGGQNKISYQYMPRWYAPLLILMLMSILLSISVSLGSFLNRKSGTLPD